MSGLAAEVAALRKALEDFAATNSTNLKAIRESFALSDIHVKVMTRMIRDAAEAIHDGGTGQILIENDRLNVEEYYERAQQIIRALEDVSQHAVDVGIALWARGIAVVDAIETARSESGVPSTPAPRVDDDSDYIVEEFGGNYGQNWNEQDQAPIQAGG